jgi:hypothetical protein
MLLVALAALGSARWVLVKRSAGYARLAELHAMRERELTSRASYFQERAQELRDRARSPTAHETIPSFEERAKIWDGRAEESLKWAALQHDQAEMYRRAARYPWLGAPRVDPEPE